MRIPTWHIRNIAHIKREIPRVGEGFQSIAEGEGLLVFQISVVLCLVADNSCP